MDIGQKIKALREQKGMTLEELGNKAGVGKSTVRKWETGIIANMRRDKIAKIANALDVEPSYLMGWEEDSEEHGPIADQFDEIIDYLNCFKLLNEEGRRRLMEYASDLVENPKYIKKV